jgi:hypothetical protein
MRDYRIPMKLIKVNNQLSTLLKLVGLPPGLSSNPNEDDICKVLYNITCSAENPEDESIYSSDFQEEGSRLINSLR